MVSGGRLTLCWMLSICPILPALTLPILPSRSIFGFAFGVLSFSICPMLSILTLPILPIIPISQSILGVFGSSQHQF